jgi:hypothetical protein
LQAGGFNAISWAVKRPLEAAKTLARAEREKGDS